MAFWNKKKKVEPVEEKIEKEEPKKYQYSLEGIAIASSLTEKGYESIKKKLPKLASDMEKTDPDMLPMNASDERYDKASEKYYWLLSRITRNEDALQIIDIIGYKKGGHGLTEFHSDLEVIFDYFSYNGNTKTIKGNVNKYNFADFKINFCITEPNKDKADFYLEEKMQNVSINGNTIDKIDQFFKKLANEQLYKTFEDFEATTKS